MDHEIVVMKKADIKSVTSLHQLAFPQSRSTKLGYLYVRKMFKWFLKKQPELSIVAKINGEVIGYVVGAIGGYGRKLFRYAFFEVLLGLLIHPKLWFQSDTFLLWRSYLKGLFPKLREQKSNYNEKQKIVSAALAGIGVSSSHRKKGIGRALVSAFEDAARKSNATQLSLSVHMNNISAQRLYENCGWFADSKNKEENTIHYIKILS